MGKNRNIVLCIVFSIITAGIYGIYWFVKLTNETNDMAHDSNNKSASGGIAFIFTIITAGIYGYYWAYKLGKRTDDINGNPSGSMAVVFLVLQLVGLGIVNYCIAQSAINNHTN